MYGSMDGSWVEERDDGAGERARQERDVSVSHVLIEAEYALVREGVTIGRALAAAGLTFDPATFVAMRILEASVLERVESLHTLSDGHIRDLIARSAARTTRLLADDPRQLATG
jgi:hypothetical protein